MEGDAPVDPQARGLWQCTQCKVWKAPDDIANFAGKDWLRYPVRCVRCAGA